MKQHYIYFIKSLKIITIFSQAQQKSFFSDEFLNITKVNLTDIRMIMTKPFS